MYRDVGKLLVYNTLKEVRVGGLIPPPVHHARVEIAGSLPVEGEVTEEGRLQQRAAMAVLAPPPSHVVRTAHLDSQDAGPVGYQELV